MEKLPDGRYRLRENFIMGPDTCEKIDLPITEKTLVETVNGIKEKAIAKYRLKIWSKDKNKNKRSYLKVIPTVIADKKVTLGFANHPEDGKEDVTKIFSVQKNPQEENGWLTVDVLFVGGAGSIGQLAVDVLEAGGYIELSSSCLGDVDFEGNVQPEGFELERYGDWVWNASNALFQFTDQTVVHEQVELKIDESFKKEDENNLSEKKLTILKDKEKEIMADNSILEKNLKISIKNLIKEAEAEGNPKEKLSAYHSLKEYASDLKDSTLIESIDKRIVEIEGDIAVLVEKGKSTDALKEEVATKDQSLKEAVEKSEALTEEAGKLKEQVETLSKLYEEKKVEAEKLEKSVNIIKVLKEKYSALSERYLTIEAEKNSMADPDKYSKLCEANKKLVNTFKSLKAENDTLKIRVSSLSKANTKLAERQEKLLNEGKEPRHFSNKHIQRNIQRTIQKDRVKESFLNEEVKEYFEQLVKDNPYNKSLKEDFKSFESLEEAQLFMVRGRKVEEKIEKSPIIESKQEAKDGSVDKIFQNTAYANYE